MGERWEEEGAEDANFPLREFLRVGFKAAQTNHRLGGDGSGAQITMVESC